MAREIDELDDFEDEDETSSKVPVRKQAKVTKETKEEDSNTRRTTQGKKTNLDEDEENGKEEESKSISAKKPRTNIDAVKRLMGNIGSTQKFWKPQPGENSIRILPSNRKDGLPYFATTQHHGFFIDGRKRAFPCLGVFKKPCPACKVIRYYENDGDPDIEKILEVLKPKRGYLFNVIDRSDPTQSVKMYQATPPVAREVVGYFVSEDYGDITDVDKGFDIVVTKEGADKSTRYKARARRKESAIGVEGWEDGLYDLEAEAYVEIPDYNQYIEYLQDNFGDTLTNITKATAIKAVDSVKKKTTTEDDL